MFSDAFSITVLTIITWELGRFVVTKTIDIFWEDHKVEMMDECDMCFKKVPNLEYHRPRCPKKQKFTHYGRGSRDVI